MINHCFRKTVLSKDDCHLILLIMFLWYIYNTVIVVYLIISNSVGGIHFCRTNCIYIIVIKF